ncbi:decaprenyl-phosphate phosphoribosyltransferase [Candidatus Flexifilum breve]|uniref:decaprenyl-phosphate phosphoribosyltransferase n=1 Tax=Candidatus Flexifilum breve TaxID=3140694 RepID=UPI0031CC7F2D
MQALIGLIRTMRPKQWTKNVVVYAGIVFDGQLFNVDAFLRITLGFVLLCLISSSIYLINDLVDIEADRQHPKKRFRAIPSGQLPVPIAIGSAIILVIATLGIGFALSPYFAAVLLTYLIIHLLYSFYLKHIVLLDIFAVASGFILRVLAGVTLVQVMAFSPWLYASIGLLALFLVIGKRRQELVMLADKAGSVRATLDSYNLPLLDDMLRMVTTATLVTYILYTIEAPSILLAGTNLALLTVPFVLYALFRYLYLIHVKGEGSAPDEVLLKDRPLLIAILLWGLTFVAILYLPAIRA